MLDSVRKRVPSLRPSCQFRQPLRCNVIDLAFTPAVFFLPRADNQTRALQSMQGGVECSLFESKRIVTAPLDFARNPIAMPGRGFKYGQYERGRIAFKKLFIN